MIKKIIEKPIKYLPYGKQTYWLVYNGKLLFQLECNNIKELREEIKKIMKEKNIYEIIVFKSIGRMMTLEEEARCVI